MIKLYASMLRIRMVEEALADRYAEQQMRCPMHLCIGQEAIAVGVCASLQRRDRVYSNHRAHGHYLAKGGDLKSLIAELYGRTTGCCGGRGGSMHLIDTEVGFMGATPIVGGTIPVAVGAAWATKLKHERDVTCLFFGDGCFEEGVLHESMNFAVLHHLPIIFVCENNDCSVYTPLRDRQPDRPIHAIANAHGCNTFHGDGNDLAWVHHTAQKAVAHARTGEGPCFIEATTYRWREHCGPDVDDALGYRSAEAIEAGRASDPLLRCRRQLLSDGAVSEAQLDQLHQSIAGEIAQAFDWAIASPTPTLQDGARGVYA